MNSREGIPAGRNIEKDKAAFIEGVEQFKVEAIETDFDAASRDTLAVSLDKTKMFVLGEIHGAQENPNIIYTLWEKFGFKDLALEWPPEEMQAAVDQFLQDGQIDFSSIEWSPDGRITSGHFALLRKLKEEGLLDRVICFDRRANNENQRDRGMARIILDAKKDSPMLVVAGSFHTNTTPQTIRDGSPFSPMGEHIRAGIPEVPVGEIKYLSGSIHNIGIKKVEDTGRTDAGVAAFYREDDGLFIYELPEAHPAIVPDPTATL